MKLYLLGGFLGSGKTTAIQQSCRELLKQGIQPGVITNDQGIQLVDSGFIRSLSFPGREVTSGCFCCHYDKLESSVQSLRESDRPAIIFAESVGSCTDLVATVIKPLLRFHPEMKVVLSVFADARILLMNGRGIRCFNEESVQYIYQKQLDEADLLIVNKWDLLSREQRDELKEQVEAQFGNKEIIYQNSLDKESVVHWLSALDRFEAPQARASLELDYDKYGEGESRLAWLDEEIAIETSDKKAVWAAMELIHAVYTRINAEELPIGHLKFLLDDGQMVSKTSFTSFDPPRLVHETPEYETDRVVLLINARVETDPERLLEILSRAVDEIELQTGCRVIRRQSAAFKPGYPTPTHRMV